MRTKLKNGLAHGWREWIRPMLVVVIVCCSFRSAVADWNDVPTGSMKPTIIEGDRIFVNKLAYGLRMPFTSWQIVEREGPQRGDVVVFFEPNSGERMVKRVIGLPGDRVSLRNNHVFINGRPASYESLGAEVSAVIPESERRRYRFAGERIGALVHPVMTTPFVPSRRTFGPVEVPDGQYFMMGDNRDNSRDSRWFGCIARDRIVGRATSILFSYDAGNYYIPRASRFLHDLP